MQVPSCKMRVFFVFYLAVLFTPSKSCIPFRHLRRDCNTPVGYGYSGLPMDLSEPEVPDVFHDLTTSEMDAVRKHLEESIGLVKPEAATLRDPQIYTMWLEMPPKAAVLQHLDDDASQPPRQARVMVWRGDLDPPMVQEVVCGPLTSITGCTVKRTAPFAHRPQASSEYDVYSEHVIPEIHRLFGDILRESYDASFDYENCEDDCLNYFNNGVSNNLYGLQDQRKIWLLAMYDIEYYSLYAVDFAVLVNVDGVDGASFTLEKVWYSGQIFDSPEDFVQQYNANTINKTKISRPSSAGDSDSTLKPRGPFKPKVPQRPPQLIEPDDHRYIVTHRKVDYLDMWTFHYRISSLYGPVLNDIRFNGERIVYEISLQELMVVYSGDNPVSKITTFVDSNYLTGSRSKALVKGTDCPTTATLLSKTVPSQGREEPVTFKNAACVFEQNTGRPLRRHHSYTVDEGAFYGGMSDSFLVVRSIHTVDNYDYIIDFKFHQNGAIGVSVGSVGFIYPNFYTEAERPYGVKLNDLITAPVHMHAFNFKVDLDINGTSNRYETIDLSEEKSNIRGFTPPRTVSQVKVTNSLKSTEQEAVLRYDFDQPKYHVFHNDAARNHVGERKSYRLVNHAMVKMLVEEGAGTEPGYSWARYQMAVTKHKDSEKASSVPYNMFGPQSPSLSFQSFIDDNEGIVDEDLVTWVTMGVHHVPHSEDLPTTSTPGKEASFYLHPYNYFPICPSMYSRDGVFIEHKNDDPEQGISWTYPDEGNHGCLYVPHEVPDQFQEADDILATEKDLGVL